MKKILATILALLIVFHSNSDSQNSKFQNFTYYLNSNESSIEFSYSNSELSKNWILNDVKIENSNCGKNLNIKNRNLENIKFILQFKSSCESKIIIEFINGKTFLPLSGHLVYVKASQRISTTKEFTNFTLDKIFTNDINDSNFNVLFFYVNLNAGIVTNNFDYFTKNFGQVYFCSTKKSTANLNFFKKNCIEYSKKTKFVLKRGYALAFLFSKNYSDVNYLQFKFNLEINGETLPLGGASISLYGK